MELDEAELMDGDEEEEDGVTRADLEKALKAVRGKKALIKLDHKLKKNLRARSKNKKLSDMEAHLESKGINVNKESLRARVKKRRTIGELEQNQDAKAKNMLDSDGESDEDMDDEVNTRNALGERRGRKRQRSLSSDSAMDVDEGSQRGAKKARSLTPAQLKVRSQSKVRTMSQGRREGSVPQRHPSRMVPEESIRLAKKINKRFKHSININEADRRVTVKKPKHLYSGKRSNGKNERR